MTTQQFNFAIYSYLLDEGKNINLLQDQEELDKEWEEKISKARNKPKTDMSKEEIVKETTDKLLRNIK